MESVRDRADPPPPGMSEGVLVNFGGGGGGQLTMSKGVCVQSSPPPPLQEILYPRLYLHVYTFAYLVMIIILNKLWLIRTQTTCCILNSGCRVICLSQNSCLFFKLHNGHNIRDRQIASGKTILAMCVFLNMTVA